MVSASELIGIVSDLIKHPRTLVGSDMMKIDGPGGQWKIRLEERRGYWQHQYTSPERKNFYSLKALVAFLTEACPDDDVPPYDATDPPTPEHIPVQLPEGSEAHLRKVSSRIRFELSRGSGLLGM